jgi:KAP family P-loop domain
MSDSAVNDQFVLLNDQPVTKLDSKDVLGIASEVSGLANLIMESRYSAPFTVGIDADWGMGKSTLMLQLQAALDARSKEGVVTRWFNAWTAQRGDVLAGLIKSALMAVDENALRRLLRQAAANRGLLIGLRVTLTAVASFLHLGSAVDHVWDLMSVDTRTRNEMLKDLEVEFYKWAAQTKRTPYGRLLVVFVDDLDRCSTETIVGSARQ